MHVKMSYNISSLFRLIFWKFLPTSPKANYRSRNRSSPSRSICPSVRPSVCPSVRPSIRPSATIRGYLVHVIWNSDSFHSSPFKLCTLITQALKMCTSYFKQILVNMSATHGQTRLWSC